MITTKLRTLVSQDRVRHEELSLNIDLTYITERVLAMSFPASGIEAAWRNDIEDVCTLLRSKHKDNFLVWNLSERDYEYELLDNQIVCVPFPDHHAPPLHIIFQIIHHIDAWLQADENHVAIVHCVGGKGRTGLVIVCYLFYIGLYTDIDSCLSYFGHRRSAKGKGVTQASQLRYVSYFSDVVSGKKNVSLDPVVLEYVVMGPVPKGLYLFLEVYQQNYASASDTTPQEHLLHSTFSKKCEQRVLSSEGKISCQIGVEICGDILLRGYCVEGYKSKTKAKAFFRMQFHTGMLESTDVIVPRDELDDIRKDKRFPTDFELRMLFSPKSGCKRKSIQTNSMVFPVMQNLYNEMLANRAKMPPTEDLINNTRPDSGWRQGSYDTITGSIIKINVKSHDNPAPRPRDDSIRKRYRESMIQTKLPQAMKQHHLPLATRQNNLHSHLDYLEAQLAELEKLIAEKRAKGNNISTTTENFGESTTSTPRETTAACDNPPSSPATSRGDRSNTVDTISTDTHDNSEIFDDSSLIHDDSSIIDSSVLHNDLHDDSDDDSSNLHDDSDDTDPRDAYIGNGYNNTHDHNNNTHGENNATLNNSTNNPSIHNTNSYNTSPNNISVNNNRQVDITLENGNNGQTVNGIEHATTNGTTTNYHDGNTNNDVSSPKSVSDSKGAHNNSKKGVNGRKSSVHGTKNNGNTALTDDEEATEVKGAYCNPQ